MAAFRSAFRWDGYARLSAGFPVAPTCPRSFQTELVLMLTRITQLRALSLTPATSLPIAPAGSSSLQTELVLILTRPAETRTILRIGRSRKHHGKQTRRRKGNNRQFIVHVTHLSFSHLDNNRKAGSKHLPPGRATAFGRTDPRTVREKLDGARAILSGADDRRNREFYPTGSRATRRPDAPTRP